MLSPIIVKASLPLSGCKQVRKIWSESGNVEHIMQ